MAYEQYSNDGQTTLNGAINNSTTTVVVTDASKFPLVPQFRILIDSEIMIVTAVSTNTFTVTRGAESTTAASHSDLAVVVHTLTAGGLNQVLSDMNLYGTCANLPAAGKAGRLYYGSDYPMMYRDNGSTWQAFYNGRPCTVPITSNYSWTQGTFTGTNTDITNGPTRLELVQGGGGSFDEASVFTKNVPSAPYTVTARIGVHPTKTSQTSFGGLCLFDGTKVHSIGIIGESSVWRFISVRMNNLSVYGGEYFRLQLPIDPTDFWVRIVDDNTNRNTYWSADGVQFNFIHVVSRTDFLTPTQIGMMVNVNMAGGESFKITWFSDE